jgi:hypothetical protein
MQPTDISLIRLINQQIVESKLKTAKEIVGWMGAVQAQDFNMVKWAIGIRLHNSTNTIIESAINAGEIIRTHLLRPTWHFVSANDIYWMLDLTGPHIKASMRFRDRELELTETVYAKSNSIFTKSLQGGKHLTREELVTELERANIATDDNRASHLLMRAELDGVICSGKIKNNRQSYALLSERVPKITTLNRDEALSQLALTYFTSHCPATLQDFIWWSGLSVADARHALEMVKPNFISETMNQQTYWLTHSFSIPKPDKDFVHLLPAFDEFIISYKDRTAVLPFENHNKAVSNNGIFKPIIVINGQVKGIWRRTIKKGKIILEIESFLELDETTNSQIEKASLSFENFMNKKIEIVQGIKL